MILTIPTGRFAGSQIEIASPRIESIHSTKMSIEVNVISFMVEGTDGKVYLDTHKVDDRFTGLSDEEIVYTFTTEIAEEILPFVNEQLVLAFEEKMT